MSNPFDTDEYRSGALNPGTSSLRGKLHGQRIDADIRRTAREVERQQREQREADAAKVRVECAEQQPVTREQLAGARLVKDGKHGTWRQVVRVNKTNVSVATGYSWTDKIPLARIIDTRV